MICLDVEEYCHRCLDFKADVKPTARIPENDVENDTNGTQVDMVVQCSNRKRCAHIVRYLSQQQKNKT